MCVRPLRLLRADTATEEGFWRPSLHHQIYLIGILHLHFVIPSTNAYHHFDDKSAREGHTMKWLIKDTTPIVEVLLSKYGVPAPAVKVKCSAVATTRTFLVCASLLTVEACSRDAADTLACASPSNTIYQLSITICHAGRTPAIPSIFGNMQPFR
ncbi:hypothetical protein JOM56_005038 [Amanita muscaria]